MWYVLCERGDLEAMWAWRGLRDRGLEPLEIVTGDEIGAALRIEHRIGAAGVVTALELARGVTISSATARGVLNRLVAPPTAGHAGAAPADREYARQEVLALTMSWLHGLPCPVLGRPTPQGLAGPWLRSTEWTALAARAGLRTLPLRRSSADGQDGVPVDPTAGPAIDGTATTAPGTVVWWLHDARAAGPAGRRSARDEVLAEGAPDEVVDGIARLGRLAGASLLAVAFAAGWAFAGASPLPELRPGGAALLDRLAATLGGPVALS